MQSLQRVGDGCGIAPDQVEQVADDGVIPRESLRSATLFIQLSFRHRLGVYLASAWKVTNPTPGICAVTLAIPGVLGRVSVT